MRLPYIATRVGDWRDPCGWEQVLCGVRTWAIYLAPWYLLDGRLGLTHPNQSASHLSKKRELWLPFLPWLESIRGGNQSWPGWWTSGAWVAGSLYVKICCACPGCAWLEPLAEWFYATEYISSIGIPSISGSKETNFSSILSLVIHTLCVLSNYTT